MSRLIKESMVTRYQTRFRDVSDAAVISAQGVDVQKMTAFRGALRAKGIRAMTVQNRICRRALESTNLKALGGLLTGPSTVVWGADNIVTIAKALTDEAKNLKQIEIRGGVTSGQVLSKADIESLSRMPSREELLGQVIGRALGQAMRLSALIQASGGRLTAQVREVEKKAPPAPEAAAAPVAEAAPAEAKPAEAAPPAGETPKA